MNKNKKKHASSKADNTEQKKPKKGIFTLSEIEEIENAMASRGFHNFSDFVMYHVRNDYMGESEKRRIQKIQYVYSNLLTTYNQLHAGINMKENRQKFMREAGKLCQELM